jgi:hypothetical protein
MNLAIELLGAGFFFALGLVMVFARDTVWRIYNGGVEPRKPELARTPGWDESVGLIGKILIADGCVILLSIFLG